ncbi:hypothetical protein B0H19DRAFT_1059993 [Mycena capillaripes]|nr:hypothetical protein B0H19DRAFT_1059993 [Mycena capillaripes]
MQWWFIPVTNMANQFEIMSSAIASWLAYSIFSVSGPGIHSQIVASQLFDTFQFNLIAGAGQLIETKTGLAVTSWPVGLGNTNPLTFEQPNAADSHQIFKVVTVPESGTGILKAVEKRSWIRCPMSGLGCRFKSTGVWAPSHALNRRASQGNMRPGYCIAPLIYDFWSMDRADRWNLTNKCLASTNLAVQHESRNNDYKGYKREDLFIRGSGWSCGKSAVRRVKEKCFRKQNAVTAGDGANSLSEEGKGRRPRISRGGVRSLRNAESQEIQSESRIEKKCAQCQPKCMRARKTEARGETV